MIHKLHQYQNIRKAEDQIPHMHYQHPPIIIISKHHILLQKSKTIETKIKLLSMMTYHPSILSKALLYQPLFLSIAQLKTSIRNKRRSSGFPKAKLPLDRHYTTSMNEGIQGVSKDIFMILQCLWQVFYNIPLK